MKFDEIREQAKAGIQSPELVTAAYEAEERMMALQGW